MVDLTKPAPTADKPVNAAMTLIKWNGKYRADGRSEDHSRDHAKQNRRDSPGDGAEPGAGLVLQPQSVS